MAGMTAWAAIGQMANFTRRKKGSKKNMSLLDDHLQVRVVGKTHQSPPPGLSFCPGAPSSLLTLKFSSAALVGGRPTSSPSSNLGFLDSNALFYTDQTPSFSAALSAEGLGRDSLKKTPRGIENPLSTLGFRGLGRPIRGPS